MNKTLVREADLCDYLAELLNDALTLKAVGEVTGSEALLAYADGVKDTLKAIVAEGPKWRVEPTESE